MWQDAHALDSYPPESDRFRLTPEGARCQESHAASCLVNALFDQDVPDCHFKPAAGACAQPREAVLARPVGHAVLWSDIVTNRPSTHRGSASTRVFAIPELTENILRYLDTDDLHRIQSTSYNIDTLIKTSPSLKSNVWQQKKHGTAKDIHWTYDLDSDKIQTLKISAGTGPKTLEANGSLESSPSVLVHAVNPIFLEPRHDGDLDSIATSATIRYRFFNRIALGNDHSLYPQLHDKFQSQSDMDKVLKSTNSRDMQLAWPPVRRVVVKASAEYAWWNQGAVQSEEVKAESGVTIGNVFEVAKELRRAIPASPAYVSIRFPDSFVKFGSLLHHVECAGEEGQDG